MNQKTLRLIASAALVLACSTVALAQEDGTPVVKKPVPNAQQDAKAKAREKKAQAKVKASADAKAKAVDINHATKEELKKLPGITDAIADAIIAKRPYKSKADLVEKKILPNGTFQSLRKQLAAK